MAINPMVGRPRITDEKAKLKGTKTQGKPLNTSVVPRKPIKKPADLSKEASEEWDRIINDMPPGLFKSVDLAILRVYCEAYATRAAALRIVEEDGLMAVRGANQLMIHPAAMLARAQSDLMIKATDRLGFSPVARARMAAPDNPEKDDEDDLFTKPN